MKLVNSSRIDESIVQCQYGWDSSWKNVNCENKVSYAFVWSLRNFLTESCVNVMKHVGKLHGNFYFFHFPTQFYERPQVLARVWYLLGLSLHAVMPSSKW